MNEVRRLEIRARRRVDDLMSGQYHSAYKGQGIEFAEVREYQPGDEVRSIDWNVTARAGRPFVKRFVEERQLTVVLAFDCGITSGFGTARVTKLRLAAEVGAVISLAAARNNDLVGLHTLGAEAPLHIPPKKGRTHTLRIIREMLNAEPAKTPGSVDHELQDLARVLKRPAIIFVLSDLLQGLNETPTPGWMHPLRLLARKHDLTALTLSDPREQRLPSAGVIEFADPMTGQRQLVDTTSRRVRSAYEAAAIQDDERIDRFLNEAKVDRVALSTDRSPVDDLVRYFNRREARSR